VVRGKTRRDPKSSPDRNRLSVYDIGVNKWSAPKTEGPSGTNAFSHTAFFTYDATNDVAILHVNKKHYVYSPEKQTWALLPNTLPGNVKWYASSGFYDEKLNAHFYFNAKDSGFTPGNMWVWRYAPALDAKKAE